MKDRLRQGKDMNAAIQQAEQQAKDALIATRIAYKDAVAQYGEGSQQAKDVLLTGKFFAVTAKVGDVSFTVQIVGGCIKRPHYRTGNFKINGKRASRKQAEQVAH